MLAAVAAVGVGTATFQRAAVAAAAAQPEGAVTPEMVKNAEWIAGVELTEAERKTVAGALTNARRNVATFHKLDIGYSTPPAISFTATPGEVPSGGRGKVELVTQPGLPKKPESDDDLAFAPLTTLAGLLQSKQVTSVELTKLYLGRLKKYDPAL